MNPRLSRSSANLVDDNTPTAAFAARKHVRRRTSLKSLFTASKPTAHMADAGSLCSETSSTSSSVDVPAVPRRQKTSPRTMMSTSVTDLRCLPGSDARGEWLKISNAIQEEINDRRHDILIAEIEISDSLMLAAGPTMRYAQEAHCGRPLTVSLSSPIHLRSLNAPMYSASPYDVHSLACQC